LVAVASVGCQNMVAVTRGPLVDADQPVSDTIQVADLAENVRKEPPQRVGTHTFTVFGIPAGDINCEQPLPDVVHPFVAETLRKAGYKVTDVRGKKAAREPILRGEITKFWFAGYSWFWPVIVQIGEFKYRLVLQQPNGTVLWEKDLKGDSGGVGFVADVGFDRMVKEATTKVLNQVIGEVTSQEFRNALHKK